MAAARKVTALDDELVRLSTYAEQAVLAGNDADATKFLEAKGRAAAEKAEAEKSYGVAKQNSDRMRELTKKLMVDVQQADDKLNELQSKLAVAKQTEKMNELNEKIAGAGTDFSEYDRLADVVQKRIDAADAKADLGRELNANYDIDTLKQKYDSAATSADTSVANELAALKAKLGK